MLGDVARVALALHRVQELAGLGHGGEADQLDRRRRSGRSRRAGRSRSPSRARVRTRSRRRPRRPGRSVPSWTSTVATGPRPLSSSASSTTPRARRAGSARSSSTSACSRIISSSCSSPVPLSRRHVHADRVAAEVLGNEPVLHQPLATQLRIGVGQVDLVDRDDQRHFGRLGVIDRLDRLGHDAFGRGHHENHDVGDLGAARAHQREGLVAGRIDERDAPLAHGGLVGADVLGDAARFACRPPSSCGLRRAATSCRGRRDPSR